MAVIPLFVAGKLRMVNLPVGDDAKEQWIAQEEAIRIAGVWRRRLYYEGEQYDEQNLATAKECNVDLMVARLPEHLRLHAYSTQIQESIDFLADQMAQEFELVAEDPNVQAVLDSALEANDRTSDGVEDIARDALQAGDVAVRVGWDAITQSPTMEFWESETVEFRWASRTKIDKVLLREMIWIGDSAVGPRQVLETRVYSMRPNEVGIDEAIVEVFWDDSEEPVSTERLELPFLPWTLLRVNRKKLRVVRGESMITDQVICHADRLNAVETVAYLISRYNSHGNLAVIGDAALLEARQEERISKDIADVLTFPGGTALQEITLPTDPSMIIEQKASLTEAIFSAFGLTRLDAESVAAMGQVSGYALEILNRKTEGTFRRIRRNWAADWLVLANMLIDVHAIRSNDVLIDQFGTVLQLDAPLEDGQLVLVPFWLVDVEAEFPNREIEVRMGSGYIVDSVLVRDDFTAGLISQREALRQRGYDDDEIDKIIGEQENEKPVVPEISFPSGTAAGAVVGTADRGGQF